MLEVIGETAAAQAVEGAVIRSLESRRIKNLSAGRMGMGPREVGGFVTGNV